MRFFLRCKGNTLVPTIAILTIVLALSGCANQEAIQTERLLAASGFKMQLADTSNRTEHIKTFPQRKLTPYKRDDGQTGHLYADAEFCKCVYSGSEESYDRFERLSTEQGIAMEDRESAQMLGFGAFPARMWDRW